MKFSIGFTLHVFNLKSINTYYKPKVKESKKQTKAKNRFSTQ